MERFDSATVGEEDIGKTGLSDDFDHLRWFELPARCLTSA